MSNAKIKIKKDKKDPILEAIKEIERGKYTECKDFEEFKKALCNEIYFAI